MDRPLAAAMRRDPTDVDAYQSGRRHPCALNDPNAVGNRRQENGLTLVDLKLKEGDLLTIADSTAGEPA
jgi:hypothetical protein